MRAVLIAFLWLLLAAAPRLSAQGNDSLRVKPSDSVLSRPRLSWTMANEKTRRLSASVLPASLLVYGFLSMHVDMFQDINEAAKEEIYTEHKPRKDHLDNYLQYAPAASVYLLNLAGVKGAHNLGDRTLIYAMSNLFLGTAVYSLKSVTGEIRPDGSNAQSFPSGHTATAFASAEFLRMEYKSVSPWYGVAGYAAAAFTGYLRIQNNKHWVGDVVAGAGVGLLSTKMAYWFYPEVKRWIFKNHSPKMVIAPTYQQGAWQLALVKQF